MDLQQGLFAVKLCELEEEYGRLQSRIKVCQEKDLEQLHNAVIQSCDEFKEQNLLLEQRVQGCQMRSVSELDRAQLDFRHKVEQLLQTVLEPELAGKKTATLVSRTEAASLFAEYAIDFASQSIRYALCSAMRAMELQLRAEHRSAELEGCENEKHRLDANF